MSEKKHLRDCPDCQLESEIAKLVYEQLGTVTKQKARKLASEIVKLVRDREP